MKPGVHITLVLAALLPSAALAQTPPAPSEPTAPAPLPPPPPPASAEPAAPRSLPPPPSAASFEARPTRGGGFTSAPGARHAIYIEVTSVILSSSIGVSYAWRPLRGLALSAGLGAGYLTIFLASVRGYGGQAMAHLLFGPDGSSSFELAAGASLVTVDRSWIFSASTSSLVSVLPSAFVGYRYHPLDGGFLFRAGGAWTYGLGFGLNLTFGGAF